MTVLSSLTWPEHLAHDSQVAVWFKDRQFNILSAYLFHKDPGS